jgi:GT2 family glycosyltransferase
VAASLSPPSLTVAIPTYNGAAHLREALESILQQDGVALDLVVSDDHSDDDTLKVVRAVVGDRARIDAHSERLGLAGNWNRCAALCRTPFLAILHQDDVMKSGHLLAHLDALESDERIGLVASATEAIDEHGSRLPPTIVGPGGLGLIDRVLEPGALAAEMSLGNPLRCSAVTMRLAAFAQVGGFDAFYRYVLDWDFWLRVSRQWKVAWLATPTVQVRWHRGSETFRLKTGTDDLDETSRLLERFFAIDLKDRTDASRLRQAAVDRLARAFLSRAYEALHAGRPKLARHSLRQALERSPRVMTTMLTDPRLGIQMAVLAVAPQTAARWFNASTRDRDPTGASP